MTSCIFYRTPGKGDPLSHHKYEPFHSPKCFLSPVLSETKMLVLTYGLNVALDSAYLSAMALLMSSQFDHKFSLRPFTQQQFFSLCYACGIGKERIVFGGMTLQFFVRSFSIVAMSLLYGYRTVHLVGEVQS